MPLTNIGSKIDARLEKWTSSGNPQDLWPHISPDMMTLAHRRLVSIAGAVLRRHDRAPQLPVADTAERDALGVAAFTAGMGPLLGHWIKRGVIMCDPATAELLALHLRHGRQRAARLNEIFVRTVQSFNRRGITPVVLKGTFTSRRYFPEPGTRPTADIDLLIEPHQLHDARAALRAEGLDEIDRGTPGQTEWRPREPRQFHSLELDHARNPWSVDLHTSIDRRYFRGASAAYGSLPFRATREWSVSGLSAKVLEPAPLVAYLAQHAGYPLHEVRLIHIVELALVIRWETSHGNLQWNTLAEVLTDTGNQRFAYPAFAFVDHLVPGLIAPAFQRALESRITRRMRRVAESMTKTGMRTQGRGSVAERLVWARGPLDIARNVGSFLWPEAAGARDRTRKYWKWVRMALRGRFAMRS